MDCLSEEWKNENGEGDYVTYVRTEESERKLLSFSPFLGCRRFSLMNIVRTSRHPCVVYYLGSQSHGGN